MVAFLADSGDATKHSGKFCQGEHIALIASALDLGPSGQVRTVGQFVVFLDKTRAVNS